MTLNLNSSKKLKMYELLHTLKEKERGERVRVLCVNHLLYYLNFGLFAAMEEKGYEVFILPLPEYPAAEQKDILVYWLDKFKPHFVFTPGWSINLFETEQFLEIIHEYNLPHIYWATEDPIFFEEVSLVFAPHCDYVFTLAEECNLWYRELKIPSSTLTFACNPEVFRPMPAKNEYKYDIVLAANNYYWFSPDKDFRRRSIDLVLKPLVEHGYNLKVWGAYWTNPNADYTIPSEFYAGYIDYRETSYLYSSAKIVLGLQSVNTSLTQTSCRTYEIMGCGAFHLAPFTPAYANLFKNFYHLVWSNSPEETLELVDYFLKNDWERNKIALQGREEILAKHTYMHRLEKMEKDLMNFLSGW
ncbi:glycosyltransferase [Thermosyntropha sp.]|uniref:CgeB family protein n=1 Tax=Thermosyntropha sp. TaxID=2740820 RepID=UPI0025EE3C94|nr:glycosyltransferase [Thermosyntropha sp.]MBO8158626.1 glycosyltransferase [Thermosyntropha sp.]